MRNTDDIRQELDGRGQFLIDDGVHPPFDSQVIENNEEIDQNEIREVIIEEIGTSPLTVDELRRQCQVSAPVLAAVLLDLELDGRIERLPGNRICGLGDV